MVHFLTVRSKMIMGNKSKREQWQSKKSIAIHIFIDFYRLFVYWKNPFDRLANEKEKI